MCAKLSKGPRFDPGRIRFLWGWGLYFAVQQYLGCVLRIMFASVVASSIEFCSQLVSGNTLLCIGDGVWQCSSVLTDSFDALELCLALW